MNPSQTPTLSARLVAGETLVGVWIGLEGVASIELAGACGFDWAVLDLEHGHFDGGNTLHALRAADTVQLPLIVRVPDVQSSLIGRCLDWGAAGIMAPNVHTAQDARTLVEAMRFAPDGRRGLSRSVRAAGYGGSMDSFLKQQQAALAIVQIESQRAAQNVREIAAVEGVDVLFLGHTDLSQDLGCFGNLQDPRILEIEESLLAACAQANKRAGMALSQPSHRAHAAQRGFRFVTAASDVGLLRSGLKAARSE